MPRLPLAVLTGLCLCLLAAPAHAQGPVVAPPPVAPAPAAVAEEPMPELPAEADRRRLDLYGFADVSYFQPLMADDNPFAWQLFDNSNFMVGALNLYLDAELADRLRSLIEVRFLYSPGGDTEKLSPTGKQTPQDTSLRDTADYGHQIRWGGIMIERAWVEYDLHRLLTIRAGQFLTPYGIWNVDHGSPVVIGIRRPYVVGDQLFPERQTGLELHGREMFGSLMAGYHLTISNGRGPQDTFRDLDENKALGGRLWVERRASPSITLGLSGYRGRFTRASFQYSQPGGLLKRETQIEEQYDELSIGVDLAVRAGPLLFNGEITMNDRAYTTAGRRLAVGVPDKAFLPDGGRRGAYAMLGWRTPWMSLMPYVLFEHFKQTMPIFNTPNLGPIPEVFVYYAGFNWRMFPNFVLKLEGAYGIAPGSPLAAGHRLKALQAQAAWAF